MAASKAGHPLHSKEHRPRPIAQYILTETSWWDLLIFPTTTWPHWQLFGSWKQSEAVGFSPQQDSAACRGRNKLWPPALLLHYSPPGAIQVVYFFPWNLYLKILKHNIFPQYYTEYIYLPNILNIKSDNPWFTLISWSCPFSFLHHQTSSLWYHNKPSMSYNGEEVWWWRKEKGQDQLITVNQGLSDCILSYSFAFKHC